MLLDPKRSDRQPLFTDLVEREMEVLRLISADQLVISIGTALGHVGNILSKLHLADHTQAAVYAWKKDLIQHD